jgi:lysophospholipase L1-like esterase
MSTNKPGDYNNLGHPSMTPASRPLRPGWLERHRRYCDRAQRGGVDLLFIGDSLTQRWEGAPAVWDRYFAPRNAAQMGIDNDGTQQLLWRIDDGTLDGIHPKLVVLLIGINNLGNDNAKPAQIRDGVAAVLGRIHKKLPDAKVLLLGLLPYDRPGVDYSGAIHATNNLLATLADWQKVCFLDIGPKLLVDGKVSVEVQHDGAHLSEKGYEIYAQAIEPLVRELMDER